LQTVVAKTNGLTATGQVSIVGGVPDAHHLSIAAQYLNLNTQFLGLQDTITAIVGDRFGNVVADGTRVNFISEGGTIGQSQSTGAFTATTVMGQASAILQTAVPTTPQLNGVAPAGNVGFNRIVVFTTGSESFTDNNGNGRFDAGIDYHSDVSEPYIDGNDSGAFEAGELYIDVNNNGRFDGPDAIFQDNTTIWTSMNVLFSMDIADREDGPCIRFGADSDVICRANGSFGSIANGQVKEFYLYNVQDEYGNALVSGTTLKVTASGGVLGGSTDITLPDQVSGGKIIHFTLTGKPANIGTEGQETYPLPSNATVTVEITMPNNEKAPGGRGSKRLLSFSGIINAN